MSTPTPNAQRSLHEQGWTSSLPGAKLRRVTQYIKENADKDLTLTALAAVVNMSPTISRGSSGTALACRPTDSWSGSESTTP